MFYRAIRLINRLSSSILLSTQQSVDNFGELSSRKRTLLNRIKHELVNGCGVSDNYFQCQAPLPEVGTQGSEGKTNRLLMFLLCDVFLEKEKDLFLCYVLFPSSVRKNPNVCALLFIFGKEGRVSSSFFGRAAERRRGRVKRSKEKKFLL